MMFLGGRRMGEKSVMVYNPLRRATRMFRAERDLGQRLVREVGGSICFVWQESNTQPTLKTNNEPTESRIAREPAISNVHQSTTKHH